MNKAYLKGTIKNIEPSHEIDGIQFNKANLITKRTNGQEDIVNLRFKAFSNKHKENDEISIVGNIRSYSYKVNEDKNKVVIYVFTYFDEPEEELAASNVVNIDGRICKMNVLRKSKGGRDNLHFIIANNLVLTEGSKRLNSYIPCIAWGTIAKEMSQLKVNDKIEIEGELHSREHKKVHPDGEVEFRVAHELLVTGYKLVD